MGESSQERLQGLRGLALLLWRSSKSEGREWGVGSVVVGFGVFGAPRFSVQRPKNACFKGFWYLWTENRGAPKMPNPTATDPTPHSHDSRPSDFLRGNRNRGNRAVPRETLRGCLRGSLRTPEDLGNLSDQEGVFAEKGARFRGKWGSAPSAPPPPSPLLEDPPPLGFSVKPLGFSVKPAPPPRRKGGRGRGAGVGGGGGARPHLPRKRAPFSAKTPSG